MNRLFITVVLTFLIAGVSAQSSDDESRVSRSDTPKDYNEVSDAPKDHEEENDKPVD